MIVLLKLLYGSIIAIIDNYKKSQKTKLYFLVNFDLELKKRPS